MRPASRRLGGLVSTLTVLFAVAAIAETAVVPPPLPKPPLERRGGPESPAPPQASAVAPSAPLDKPSAGKADKAPPGAQTGSVTGLPLPRFVSLAADKVNARVGPGTNYPISWVYTRRNLPVEVIAEYDLFRKIRDHDGSEAWIHKNLLSGRRYVLITGGTRMLRKQPKEDAAVAMMVEGGVQGRLLSCKDDWCQVEIQGNKGYAPRSYLWGVYADETID